MTPAVVKIKGHFYEHESDGWWTESFLANSKLHFD
jgi:hypothetical protein